MAKTIKLKKGYDIKIIGEAQQKNVDVKSRTYAVKPTDFNGIAPIPKMMVKEGDQVNAGDPLFFDKTAPNILYTAPFSGTIQNITRGEKRAIIEVVILADKEISYRKLEKMNPETMTRDKVVAHLLSTGCWPFIRQRPYNVLAETNETPKAIFISGFDTAPLAADYNFTMQGLDKSFQAGIAVLRKLCANVQLGLNANATASPTFTNAKNVTTTNYSGKHPAGCVGVQIHHTDPINKGDLVWTINPYDVVAIGRVFAEGQYNTERLIALGGPEIKNPQYYRVHLGASVDAMVKNNLKQTHVRYISGNVLTGTPVAANGHVGFFDNCLTVLEEGDKHELFGWIMPTYARPSVSRTFMAFLKPNKQYNVNTNTHGEPRAFVSTGIYESVTPMDVYPMQLLKAILYRDFDLMEGLGIYEVVEEDLALSEFVCPSKTDVQEILREGLDYMREQA